MKNIKKISILGGIFAVLTTNIALGEDSTLVDYLNGENVSFLIVNTGENARLTTFGWQKASESCKTIRTAGFNVSNISNYDAETRDETTAVCQN